MQRSPGAGIGSERIEKTRAWGPGPPPLDWRTGRGGVVPAANATVCFCLEPSVPSTTAGTFPFEEPDRAFLLVTVYPKPLLCPLGMREALVAQSSSPAFPYPATSAWPTNEKKTWHLKRESPTLSLRATRHRRKAADACRIASYPSLRGRARHLRASELPRLQECENFSAVEILRSVHGTSR